MPRSNDPLKRKHQFPDAICSMISENSGGGWLLFRINGCGEMEVHADFDNDVYEQAVRSQASIVLSGINEVQRMNITQRIIESRDQEEE